MARLSAILMEKHSCGPGKNFRIRIQRRSHAACFVCGCTGVRVSNTPGETSPDVKNQAWLYKILTSQLLSISGTHT